VILIKAVRLLTAILVVFILVSLSMANRPANTLADEVRADRPKRISGKTGFPPPPSSRPPAEGLRFAVISDIHVQAWDHNAQIKFRAALEDLMSQEPPLDELVVNGDLGDGKPDDYAAVNSILREVRARSLQRVPVVFTIGNHEFYKAYHHPVTEAWSPATFPNGESEAAALQRFLTFAQRDKVYTERYIKSYHFIFLGSEKSAMSDHTIGDAAYLSPEQLAWLKRTLREHYTPGKPVFVFLHQPPLASGGNFPGKSRFVVQQDELLEILRPYPEVVFFAGHLHLKLGSPGSMVQEGFTLFNESSTSMPRDGVARKPLPDKSEGMVVEVQGGRVSVRGRDFLQHAWLPEAQYTVDVGNRP